MTEAGPIGLIDDKSDNDLTPTLPGVLKGNFSKCVRPVVVHATTIISMWVSGNLFFVIHTDDVHD